MSTGNRKKHKGRQVALEKHVPTLKRAPYREPAPKLRVVEEKLLPHAAFFLIDREDHTLGNLVVKHMLRDRSVRTASWTSLHTLADIGRLRKT